MLEMNDVHTYYGDSYILQGVSLQVPDGCVVALLGRNGTGKTTTIHSIIGFTPPRAGNIRFNGEDITTFPAYKIARMGISLVPQGRRIFPSLSVKENIMIATRKAAKGTWDMKSVLSLFPALEDRLQHKGNQLSGGEQQMLAIARALASNPLLLLMDEPLEGLAPALVSEIARTIRQLKERGMSILLTDSRAPTALSVADYVYIMSTGKIVYESSPKDLLVNEKAKLLYLGV